MNTIRDLFGEPDNPKSLHNVFRNRRFKFFQRYLATFERPIRVLDVGGEPSFWTMRGYGADPSIEVTMLNLFAQETEHDNITCVVGNGTHMPEFADGEFDLVFSNSAIEHVHNYVNQQKMAAEIQRVGRYYYVQTPNKFFPIEPHFHLPLFQFVPHRLQLFVLTKTKLSLGRRWRPERAEEYTTEIDLLSLRKFRTLFAGGSIYKETLLGWTKSFTAWTAPGPMG